MEVTMRERSLLALFKEQLEGRGGGGGGGGGGGSGGGGIYN
jgi:hypothetical protein